MSSTEGSSIVTNGLKAHFDASNIKSFSGIGTNRIGSMIALFNSWNSLVGTSTTYSGKNGKTGIYLNITSTGASGGVNWWYDSIGRTTCLPSTQYTITALVRYSGNTPSANLLYVRQYNSSLAQTSENGKYNSANQIYAGDGFYLTWATFTTDATATSFYIHGYDYSIIQVSLEDVQCKLGGFSDISKNLNDVSLIGTTYSNVNGGAIVLNGTTDYCPGTVNCGITSDVTLSAFVKPTYNSGPHKTIICTDAGYPYGAKLMSYKNNARYGIWLGFGSTNYEAFSPLDVNDNTNKMISATWVQSTGVVNLYINGNLQYTLSTGQTSAVALNDGKIILGAEYYSIGSGGGFQGNIYNGSVYNRALSAEEIKQNFNAMRSRYGL